MCDAARFRVDRDEPLGLWRREAPAPQQPPARRTIEFDYTSRGDRVPALLRLPTGGSGPFPLVMLQHGAIGAKDAPYMDPILTPWVRGGAAVASIDFPLHGERANPKLAALLLGALGLQGKPTPAGRVVLREFVRQAVLDLQRALDVLATFPEIDATRVGYAGLSLGSIVGATYCAIDPRPRAAALALGGAGFGGPEADPAHYVSGIAPRPLLFVNASRDEIIPRAAAEALHAAAREPKQILWFDAGHRNLPGSGLKQIWRFLRLHLGLEEAG